MIAIIKNDWQRLLAEKSRLILAIVLTSIVIPLVFWFNLNSTMSLNIQVSDTLNLDMEVLSKSHVEKVSTAPKLSEILSGKIDAYIYEDRGEIKVLTNKNEETMSLMLGQLDGNIEKINQNFQKEKLIKSFQMLTFFTLFMGMVFSFLISDDKEHHRLSRLLSTKLSLTDYLLGHVVFIFLMNMLLIHLGLFVSFIFERNIFSEGYLSILMLVSLFSLLSASLSVFFSSWIETGDSTMMVGQFSIILLSLLSDSFYAFDSGNKVIDGLLYLLPTKQINLLVEASLLGEEIILPSFLVVLGSVLLLLSTVKPLKKYGGIIV
ncbi:ABC transporter permease [Vagococcus fluvialis]|uniref:ABC transporter permease n=1 Tax=Vagococcus fluvialis TaxID=2738 RepID=UPI001A8F8745|nr:ABC transporter permease [Vagococcus fluvialis]MBO0427550.1 ABC transporter permease [Vagococcus fluvialis]